MGPENLTHCLAESRPASSGTAPKIAWVLMEEAGIDGLGHEIADGEFSKRRSVVPAVTIGALPKGRVALVNWPSPANIAASAKLPRSKASAVAILNFSPGVSGSKLL